MYAPQRFKLGLLGLAGLIIVACPIKVRAQSDPSSVVAVIEQYRSGDEAGATRALIQLGYQGNAAAQFNLGVINMQRSDDATAAKEARYWFARAAEEGDVGAQFNLGMLLLNSDESLSLEVAAQWLERAAEGGHRAAQVNLGILALWWPGFPLNQTSGRQWLTLAKDAGDEVASKVLGLGQDLAVAGSAFELLYPLDTTLRAEFSRGESRVRRDEAPVYALPTGRQEPIATLSENARVQVLKKSSGWVNVRPERGLPLWIPEDMLQVNGKRAEVSVLEAGIYVAPDLDPEVYKVGTVTMGEKLPVLDQMQSWLLIEAPLRFSGWMREEDVEVRVRSILVDESESEGGAEQGQQTLLSQSEPNNAGEDVSLDEEGQAVRAAELEVKRLSVDAIVYANSSLNADALGLVQKSSEILAEKEQNGFSRGSDLPLSGWIYYKLVTTGNDSAFVNYPGARVRTKPDLGGSIVTLYQVGQEVDILEHSGNWYRIALGDKDGWIQAKNLSQPEIIEQNQIAVKPSSEGDLPDSAGQKNPELGSNVDSAIRVSKDSVLYSAASIESSSVGRLLSGMQIGRPKTDDEMLAIPVAVKTYGWIHSSLVTQTGNTGTVKSNRVRVRFDPDTTQNNIIRTYDRGETVAILERVDDWYRIALGEHMGWIEAED
jgi:uncharacterized protein YgiM (DUF1202 family)